MKLIYLCLLIFFLANTVNAQVKIGLPAGVPHPSALLELGSSTKGLLIPRLSNSEQAAITSPANGLIVYNTDTHSMQYYDSSALAWRQVAITGSILAEPALDSLHWKTDTASKRVYLRRGYQMADSFFYDYKERKFVFADKLLYTNSLGDSFPSTSFAAKYYFKNTASRRTDTSTFANNYSSIYAIMEADEQQIRSNSFSSIQGVAIVNKNNRRTVGRLSGGSFSALHAGTDTVQLLRGVDASVTHNSNGYVNTVTGINTSIVLNDSSRSNLGFVYGNRVIVQKISSTPFKIGSLFGMQVAFSNFDTTLATAVANDAYGLYINPVNMASPGRNWGIRTFTGANILGDSTFIGPAGFRPRATLEVGGTGAMIIPTGSSLQRPVATNGMMRVNNTLNTIEHFDGAEWKGTQRLTTNIDVPLISIAGGITVSVSVPGAVINSAVAISPAAGAAIPAGLFIAWARVNVADFVEIRFENRSTTATLDPAAASYNIRVIY
jgi:hypothetical protein